jgi:hypothetical protein
LSYRKLFISIGSLPCFCYRLHDQAMLIVLSRSKQAQQVMA